MIGYARDPHTGEYTKVYRYERDGTKVWVEDWIEEESESEVISAIPAAAIDWRPASIPPRPWILGTRLLRGQVSILTAVGGAGKTVLVTTSMLALSLGENLLDPTNSDPMFKLHLKGRQKVYYYSLEDDRDEFRRRVVAQLNYYGHAAADLTDYFWFGDGVADRLILAAIERKSGDITRGACIETLVKFLIDNKISVLALDPFVKAHACGENDNLQMDRLMTLIKEVAIRANCAIWLIHHSAKGGSQMDSNGSRGASSITWAARVNETLEHVTKDEMARLALTGNIVRLSPTKINLSEQSSNATRVLRIIGHPVGNGTADYPDGDFGQVMLLVDVALKPLDLLLFTAICDAIRVPPVPGDYWLSSSRHAHYIGEAFRRGGVQHAATCRAHVDQWTRDGLIIPETEARGAQHRLLKTAMKLNEVMVKSYSEKHFGT
jgi:hypothetical protein